MPLLQLYPQTAAAHDLQGLYLDVPLGDAASDTPFVYSNFVTSLDGRVAVEDDAGQDRVPATVANADDWRLYQELAARADVLLIGGRYFRQLAAGHAQAPLPLADDPAFADLHAWRREQGMRAQPDVAILSNTLDVTLPETLRAQGRRVWLFAPASRVTPEARARLADQGGEIVALQAEPHADSAPRELDGREVVRHLGRLGYRRLYSVAGPWSFGVMLREAIVDSLFLTLRLRLIGGERYQGLVEGKALPEPADFELASLYYQDEVAGEAGQLFARFDRRTSTGR
ncbi:RibD family protein [Modicisalibacter coralii]|uniref:RibD family protein n=1 Tax=Modicisalibacter coralii TaxID=2304602 RepID=UPI00100ABA84|nr:dihydrofolate reductase family protein [Halomonas coralii]